MTEMDYKHHLISYEEDENGEPAEIAVNVDLVNDLHEDLGEDEDPIEGFYFSTLQNAELFIEDLESGVITSYYEALKSPYWC